MKNENMKVQLLACDYMERTYGKDWEKKNLNHSAITNAFIDGYKVKGDEDKTARELSVSKKRAEWLMTNLDKITQKVEDEFPEVGTVFGLKIIGRDFMPDHLGALVDDDGKVLSFIQFEEEK